jgi:hypothetical protein
MIAGVMFSFPILGFRCDLLVVVLRQEVARHHACHRLPSTGITVTIGSIEFGKSGARHLHAVTTESMDQ